MRTVQGSGMGLIRECVYAISLISRVGSLDTPKRDTCIWDIRALGEHRDPASDLIGNLATGNADK